MSRGLVPGLGGRGGRGRLVGRVLLGAVVLGILVASLAIAREPQPIAYSYSQFIDKVGAGEVREVDITEGPSSTRLVGRTTDDATFVTTGPARLPDSDSQLLTTKGVSRAYRTSSTGPLLGLLSWLLPVGLLMAFLTLMGRRAGGQMSGLMSIGRSKAKLYTSEKPSTTLADVAGTTG